MIYNNSKSGTFMVKNDMRESKTITVGYTVDGVDKVREVKYAHLPTDVINDLARTTNKIARFIEKESRR